MSQADRESYYRSIKDDMVPMSWIPRPDVSGGFVFRLKDSSRPPVTESIFAVIAVASATPFVPFTLWALIVNTSTLQAVTAVIPWRVPPLAQAYIITGVLMALSGLAWWAQVKLSPKAQEKPFMSQERSLFFLAFDTFEALRAYQINSNKRHLERAEGSTRSLLFLLRMMDPRRNSGSSRLVKIPDEAVQDLLSATEASAKVLHGIGKVSFQKLKDVLEPMSVILYFNLPDLGNIHNEAKLAQLAEEAQQAWAELRLATAQLPSPNAHKKADVPIVDTRVTKNWAGLLRALVTNFLIALTFVGVIAFVVYQLAAPRVAPTSLDTLLIGCLTITLGVSGALTAAMFNKGLFCPTDPQGTPPPLPPESIAKTRKRTVKPG